MNTRTLHHLKAAAAYATEAMHAMHRGAWTATAASDAARFIPHRVEALEVNGLMLDAAVACLHAAEAAESLSARIKARSGEQLALFGEDD